jgi:hypothetical protein
MELIKVDQIGMLHRCVIKTIFFNSLFSSYLIQYNIKFQIYAETGALLCL